MDDYMKSAKEKLAAKITGNKECVMAPFVAKALLDFCQQEPEFAQAVAQGGSFQDCMKKVAEGVTSSISDIDAYKKAVEFFFPGAKIQMQLTIDLIGDAAEPAKKPEKKKGIVLRLEDFL